MMRPLWLLALPLIGAAAQSSSPTTTIIFSIEPPPASWVTGEPYTTVGQVTPTGSLATVTTTIQKFPTDLAFVATGLPVTPGDVEDLTSEVPGYAYVPLTQDAVKQSTSYMIDMAKTQPTICWYPISVWLIHLSRSAGVKLNTCKGKLRPLTTNSVLYHHCSGDPPTDSSTLVISWRSCSFLDVLRLCRHPCLPPHMARPRPGGT